MSSLIGHYGEYLQCVQVQKYLATVQTDYIVSELSFFSRPIPQRITFCKYTVLKAKSQILRVNLVETL